MGEGHRSAVGSTAQLSDGWLEALCSNPVGHDPDHPSPTQARLSYAKNSLRQKKKERKKKQRHIITLGSFSNGIHPCVQI